MKGAPSAAGTRVLDVEEDVLGMRILLQELQGTMLGFGAMPENVLEVEGLVKHKLNISVE